MKTKSIPALLLTCLILAVSSCSTVKLKVASNKNVQNVPDLGIGWSFASSVNNIYRPKIDSAINVVISNFNEQKHSFTVHIKTAGDKDYLMLEFLKGKIPTNGAKIAGYVVTGLGLIVVPAAVIVASNYTAFVAFYYVPLNVVASNVSLSPDMSGPKSNVVALNLANGALFTQTAVQVNKLVNKFSGKLNDILSDIDNQVKSHK